MDGRGDEGVQKMGTSRKHEHEEEQATDRLWLSAGLDALFLINPSVPSLPLKWLLMPFRLIKYPQVCCSFSLPQDSYTTCLTVYR